MYSIIITVISLIAVCLTPPSSHAHSGNTDEINGHHDREAGNYHFHKGPLVEFIYDSKEEAQAEFDLVTTITDTLGITIRPEMRRTPYIQGNYSYRVRGLEEKIVENQGGIFSPYSMRVFDSIRQTDIEHIVARSEAHESGLDMNGPEVHKKFARDYDNLTLAHPELNQREKVHHDPAEWMPDHNECWYAETVLNVKKEYLLTMDIAEAKVVYNTLQSCSDYKMIKPVSD